MPRYYFLINCYIQGLALLAHILAREEMPQWAALCTIAACTWLTLTSKGLPWSKYIAIAAVSCATLFVVAAFSVTWKPVWLLVTATASIAFIATCFHILKHREEYSMDVAAVGLTIPMLYPYFAASKVFF